MPLASLTIEPATGELPARVAAFLDDAETRIDEFFELRRHVKRLGFFPSDYVLVYRTLASLMAQDSDARVLCEWGSGFGVVAGLAAMLGYDVHGIEINPDLVAESRVLLEDHELNARILHGTFVPDDYANNARLQDHETTTVFSGASADDEVDVDIDEFDIIFAYPWPTEEDQYCDMFAKFADYHAILVTYSGIEGMRVYRKVGETSG